MSHRNHLISRTLPCAVLGAFLGSGAAHAQQQTVDNVTCRAGTLTVLAQAEKLLVWSLDHRGVTQGGDPKDPMQSFTQRCIGTVANVEGKLSANGWCRSVDSKTGDWTLVDWQGSDKPGFGTWSYRYGTGKFKGVTGGGTYEPLGPTRPVEAGTYQNCVRIKGTMTIPG
jgi:hypothetical protein